MLDARREWTAEQAEAIERRGGELLLDAGAGSGKTSVLVERFVHHVLEDGLAVGSILTITFTEKAAAELRDRIRCRLIELGADEQARATEGAFISTIHGFCARLLRSGSLAAGLDPGFIVLDRDQSEPLAAAAFADALGDLTEAEAVDLLAAFGAGPLRAATLSVFGRLRSSGQLEPSLPALDADPKPVRDQARLGLIDAATALTIELAAVTDPGARVLQARQRLERCLEFTAIDDLWPGQLDWVKLPGNGAALSTDAGQAYKDALAAFKTAGAAVAAVPVRAQLDALLRGFSRHYAERKRAASGVDFEDLELLALDLLRTRPELRGRWAERFERIMVDELQDTNRVQMELIETIARDNLFTVGDAQQSIYRFRHADVTLFQARGRRLQESGRRLTLQTNFRSRPEILETLNAGFETVLGEDFRPLRAGRPGSGGGDPDPCVELLLVDKGAEWELEGIASPWRLAEAGALATRVAELVGTGTAPKDIVVLIRATTDMRAYERALEAHGLPTYVIGGRGYWSHPQVLDLVAYLRAAANPHDEEALYGILASPMVGVSLDALVVLAGEARAAQTDPWTVLRDPAGRLEELGTPDREALRTFTGWFADERAGAARVSIEQLIDRALQRTGYDVTMLGMPGGRRRLANVRKLMRLGREHHAEYGPDLRGFLDRVAARVAGGGGDARESEAPVEGEGLDAIRLMTIHRAKGLEWPVVCVADLGRTPRPPHHIVRVSADGRLGLRLSRAGVGSRVSALDWDEIGREERQAEEDEEHRLFYVAMTRARERLILSGATRFEYWAGETSFSGGGPVGWIGPAFVPELGAAIAEGGGVVSPGGGSVRLRIATPEEVVAPTPAQDERAAPLPSPPAPMPARGPVAAPPSAPPVGTLSYSALGDYERCGYRFYAERVLGLPPRPEIPPAPAAAAAPAAPAGAAPAAGPVPGPTTAPPGEPPGRSGAQRGVLLHALLERLSFRRPVAPTAEAIRLAAAAAAIPAPSPQETVQLAALVGRFASSPLCARLGQATDTRKEERFAFPLAGGVLITGAIDVLAREPGGHTLIVDYKSDRVSDSDPAHITERVYAVQRLTYALAALHAGAERVEVAHCFLERPQEPVVAGFERAQRSRLEAQLIALAEGVLAHRFPVSPVPQRSLCTGCPAEGGLCSWPLAMTRREAPDRLF